MPHGTPINVLEAGSADDNLGVIVFLHGIGARGDRWRVNLQASAAAGYRALAMDFPGHGSSAKGSLSNLSVPGYSQCIRNVCSELGVVEAHLVGTSLGAHVAASIAIASPSFTRSLVLVGPIGIAPQTPEVHDGLARAITDTTHAGVRQKLRRLVHDQALVTDEWVDTEYVINNSDGAEESFALLAEYLRGAYIEDAIGGALRTARPAVRCLLVWGRDDQLVPSVNMATVRRLLPDDTAAYLIDDAGHAPYLESPDEFNRLLLDFLRTA